MQEGMKEMPQREFELYFSCFSGHMLEYKGVLYTTVEHAYHAQRYRDPAIVAEIVATRSAFAAWKLSQTYKSQQLPDWDERKVSVMEALFREKLAQHKDVHEALMRSGSEEIIKYQEDPFWGVRADGVGRNEMGKLWMKLREELKGA